MPRYTVLSPVKHGHKRHEVGARLDLSVQAAKPLLALGHIELLAVEKAPPSPPPPPAAPVPPVPPASEPAPPADQAAGPAADAATGDLLGGSLQT